MQPNAAERLPSAGIPPKFIVPNITARYPSLIALQSTRCGGVSEGPFASLNVGINTEDNHESVKENTERLCSAAGIKPENMVYSDQVHGTEILSAEKPGRYHGYDAIITDRKDLFLCIFTADCYPVMLFDHRHNAVAAVHAGWKGSAGEIVIKTIAAMQKQFHSNPEECCAYIGAGITAEAYEVSHYVAKEFSSDNSRRSLLSQEKYMLDLRTINYQQLLASGISESNIEQSPYCTSGNSDLFFSYRRDNGKTGRMVSLIGVRSL